MNKSCVDKFKGLQDAVSNIGDKVLKDACQYALNSAWENVLDTYEDEQWVLPDNYADDEDFNCRVLGCIDCTDSYNTNEDVRKFFRKIGF